MTQKRVQCSYSKSILQFIILITYISSHESLNNHYANWSVGWLHGEIIYGGTRWIEDDRSATFSEYIFLFPACLMISHWLTKNAELNSVF